MNPLAQAPRCDGPTRRRPPPPRSTAGGSGWWCGWRLRPCRAPRATMRRDAASAGGAPLGYPLLRSAPASHADARDRQRRDGDEPHDRSGGRAATGGPAVSWSGHGSRLPADRPRRPPIRPRRRRGWRWSHRPTLRWWRSSVRGPRHRWSSRSRRSCRSHLRSHRRSHRRCHRPTAGSSSAAGLSWSASGRAGPAPAGPSCRRPNPRRCPAVGPDFRLPRCCTSKTHRGVRASRPSRRWPAAPS